MAFLGQYSHTRKMTFVRDVVVVEGGGVVPSKNGQRFFHSGEKNKFAPLQKCPRTNDLNF